jgi:uncharacterized protein YjiS (DUF1127 family)
MFKKIAQTLKNQKTSTRRPRKGRLYMDELSDYLLRDIGFRR